MGKFRNKFEILGVTFIVLAIIMAVFTIRTVMAIECPIGTVKVRPVGDFQPVCARIEVPKL